MSFIDIFNARLVYGDPVAMRVAEILSEFGLRVPRHHGASYTRHPYAYALASIEKIYIRGGERLLRDTLTVVTDAWSSDEPNRLASLIVLGVASVIYFYRQHPDFKCAVLADRLSRRGTQQLLRRMSDLSTSAQSSTLSAPVIAPPHARLAVLEAYNRAARKRLPDLSFSDMKRITLGQNIWPAEDSL